MSEQELQRVEFLSSVVDGSMTAATVASVIAVDVKAAGIAARAVPLRVCPVKCHGNRATIVIH